MHPTFRGAGVMESGSPNPHKSKYETTHRRDIDLVVELLDTIVDPLEGQSVHFVVEHISELEKRCTLPP